MPPLHHRPTLPILDNYNRVEETIACSGPCLGRIVDYGRVVGFRANIKVNYAYLRARIYTIAELSVPPRPHFTSAGLRSRRPDSGAITFAGPITAAGRAGLLLGVRFKCRRTRGAARPDFYGRSRPPVADTHSASRAADQRLAIGSNASSTHDEWQLTDARAVRRLITTSRVRAFARDPACLDVERIPSCSVSTGHAVDDDSDSRPNLDSIYI
ncbi:hypothetical protein EVAR_27988_1 [Eumeta japonica]|uniref:Uncharacterized protein n=1 Tax=Eumeta variegata TaxID=151549 RepID=A0A4C1WDQ8_EUMVA|nr:hypothetical protein EVAR_27988_1 [Eumeta japonica]